MTGTDYAVAAIGLAVIAFILWFFFGKRVGHAVVAVPAGGSAPESAQTEFAVGGLHCPSCLLAVEKVIKRLDGVMEVATNFDAERAYVTHDPAKVNPSLIIEQIKKLGYSASEVTPEVEEAAQATPEADAEVKELRLRLVVSAILTIPVLILGMVMMAMPPSPLVTSSSSSPA